MGVKYLFDHPHSRLINWFVKSFGFFHLGLQPKGYKSAAICVFTRYRYLYNFYQIHIFFEDTDKSLLIVFGQFDGLSDATCWCDDWYGRISCLVEIFGPTNVLSHTNMCLLYLRTCLHCKSLIANAPMIAHKRRPLAVFDWIYALIPWLWKWLQSTFARILRAICSACVWFMWIMPAVSTWFLFVATSKVLIKSVNSLEPMTHHTSGWAGAYIIIFLSWPDRWSYRSPRAETRILRDNWFGFFSRCDYNCRQSHSTHTRTGTCSRTQSRMSVIEIRSSHVLIPRRCRRALCVCVFVCTEGIQIARFDIASGT